MAASGSSSLILRNWRALPAWSPDGSQIAYVSLQGGKPWKIYLISPQGGAPQELLPENVGEIDVSWSSDGTQLAFGRLSFVLNTATNGIQVVDMKTRQMSILPGSPGLFSPRWSPDGRYICGGNCRTIRRSSCSMISAPKSGRSGLPIAMSITPPGPQIAVFLYYDSF